MKNIFKIFLLMILLTLFGCKTQPNFNGIPNFGILDTKRNILHGGQPNKKGFNLLKEKGITNDVVLNSLDGDEYAKSIGMNVIYIPITTWEQIWGDNLDYKIPLAASYITNNTYFHCTHGMNRTMTVGGYLLINNYNYTKREALTNMNSYGWNSSLPGLKWYFNKTFKNE